MLEEALSQVTCRLPSARDTFESLSKLSPVIILIQISRPMCSKLPFTHHAGNYVSKIKERYGQCLLSNGKKKLHLRKMDSL
jgi:hypothetical protein